MGEKNILSQIIVGLVVTVVGAVIIDKIRTNPSDESLQNESASRNVNRPYNPPPSNSRDNQPVKQYPSHIPPNPPSQSEPKSERPKEEDYASYINTSSRKSEVYILITDASGNARNDISNSVAEIYRKNGKSAGIGLFRPEFLRKPSFQALKQGDSGVFQKLNLSSYTNHLVIGEIRFSERAGKLVDDTVVCTASISVAIISASGMEDSFSISNANGNGADKSQAREDALQKLLNRYFSEHSSL